MNLRARWWVLLALCAGCGNAAAVLAIQGTVFIDPPPATLLRGQSATLTYTLTNTGNEAIDVGAVATGFYADGPTSTIIIEPSAATLPCTMGILDLSPQPGQPTFYYVSTFFEPFPILPGESRQCEVSLTVSPDAGSAFTQRFYFSGAIGTQSVDIFQDVVFNLGEMPTVVPTLRWPANFILMLLIGLLGAMLVRR